MLASGSEQRGTGRKPEKGKRSRIIVIPKNLYINYANVTIGERNEIL